MAKITAVIIRRSTDENTVALVTAECDPEMIESISDLYGAISHAVTAWARNSGRGKDLLRNSGGKICVDDLASLASDVGLATELAKWGVTDLRVDCRYAQGTAWDYDDNLYDSYLASEEAAPSQDPGA